MYKIILILLLLLPGCSPHKETPDQSVIHVLNGSRFKNVSWSPDGKQISYIKDGELWVRNLESERSRKIVSDIRVSRSAWINSNLIMYYNDSYDPTEILQGDLWIQEVDTGKKDLFKKEVNFFDTISVYNNTVYLGVEKVGVRMFNLSASNAQPNKIEVPISNGTNYKFSPTGDVISFFDKTVSYSGTGVRRVNLSLYDIVTKKIELIEQLKDYTIYGYCWSPDGRFIAFAAQSPSNAVPSLYIYKLGSNSIPAKLVIPNNAADLEWSPTDNRIVITTVGQPSGNEILLMNIPSELLQ